MSSILLAENHQIIYRIVDGLKMLYGVILIEESHTLILI